jgi:hypothetical protein
MSLHHLRCWALLLAVGCDGKLIVDRGNAAPSGVAGWTASGGNAPIQGLAGMPAVPDVEGGSGGVNGDAGGEAIVIPADAGKIGKTCVPGGLVIEAEGTSAEATIKTLDRCDAGLSCTAQGKCDAASDCQHSSGTCTLRRVEVDQSIYDGINPDRAYTGIVGLAANDSHLYWLEYGTRDALENYLHDGALMSYSFADQTTTTVATGLDGPIRFGLTTTHAYISTYEQRVTGISHLLRVPLTGGTVEQVQAAPRYADAFLYFASVGSQAFWDHHYQTNDWGDENTGIDTMSSDPDAVPISFVSPEEAHRVDALASDGTGLFYVSADHAVMRTPISSAAATATGAVARLAGIALHDDSIFTLNTLDNGGPTVSPSGILLLRAPKSGGQFQQVRSLGAGVLEAQENFYGSTPQVVDDRYFFQVHLWMQDRDGHEGYQRRVLTAAFGDNEPPIRLFEQPLPTSAQFDHFRWVGTADALYWSDGQAIYEQPLPTP